MSRNNLTIEVFSGNARIIDVADDFRKIEGIRYSTAYPGGLYLDATMWVPRNIIRSWLIKGAQRLRILNGHQVVFEGQISNLDRMLKIGGEGVQIEALGYWGSLLGTRRLSRLYADKRTSADVWRWTTGVDAHAEQTGVSRYNEDEGHNMLRLVPYAGVAWGTNDRARLTYSAPAGEEIRRMDFDWDFDEDGQNWSTKIQALPSEAQLFYQNSTGSGSGQSVEPASGVTGLNVFITALSSQTVGTSGDLHAEYSNVTVYATMNHTPTGGKDVVDLTEITKDIRAELSELSTDENLIGANTYSLIPFIAHRYPTTADILSQASSYGDSSQNRWATGIRGSHLSIDGLPIIFAEQYPILTDFDYAIRVDENNLVPQFNMTEGYISSDDNGVWNWIVVEYVDERGFSQFVTPDDDANLKNTTSITSYGQRDKRITIGHATQDVAINVGRRFLEGHKEAVWNTRGPITVKEYIRGTKGQEIPASEIQSGKRLKVENFLRDPTSTSSDLVFLVTKTQYDDEDRTCRMTVGVPNALDVYLAQRELVDERLLGMG